MSSLGYKHSEDARRRISLALIGKKEEQNRAWKGDKAKYQARHIRLRKKYGRAKICENRESKVLKFNCKGISKIFQWAKKKGRKYTLNRNDYYQLCAGCHVVYDIYYEKIR